MSHHHAVNEPRGAVARQLHYRTLADKQTGAWAIYITHPGNQLGRAHEPLELADTHLPTVLFQVGRHPHRFRGACLGCDWESDRDDTNVLQAVEAAHDHTHTGWRTMPAVHPQPPAGRASTWAKQVTAAYPDGWFARGGPVLTIRPGPADRRPLPGRAPGGRGYDLPAPASTRAPAPAAAPAPPPAPLALIGRMERHARVLVA
ncbi:hypothetical protein BKM31_16165 [[Actinomadura] parvosata subsp. kistnae]|uniref:Uncharacterized protein n=1 Tax=[Actinomadura] parvosata subsp. kistnae TaxID=1909395 RepID=A0A1U9ZXZ9_9ACTN|nr:DUF6349 family protein [Nonomuraea sp. ATCC 55076]AQZ62789.1 hypothetical protein BKM31_16165 [Nonomuraea sp. ATCC 55076]